MGRELGDWGWKCYIYSKSQHCAEQVTYSNSNLIIITTLYSRCYYYIYFTDEEASFFKLFPFTLTLSI